MQKNVQALDVSLPLCIRIETHQTPNDYIIIILRCMFCVCFQLIKAQNTRTAFRLNSAKCDPIDFIFWFISSRFDTICVRTLACFCVCHKSLDICTDS